MSNWKWYRRLKGGAWYYCRPYDNLYSFTHMRFWINRNPEFNLIVLQTESY